MNKFLIIMFFIFAPLITRAQVNPSSVFSDIDFDNFGGIVAISFPCTATASYLMYVVDVREIATLGNINELLKIKSAADLKKFKPNLFKKVMVFPFTFSRINLFYNPLPGNYVLGTFIGKDIFKSKLGKLGLEKIGLKPEMGVGKHDPISSCLIGVCPLCWPISGVSVDGVLTPRPFSGMGTSLMPL